MFNKESFWPPIIGLFGSVTSIKIRDRTIESVRCCCKILLELMHMLLVCIMGSYNENKVQSSVVLFINVQLWVIWHFITIYYHKTGDNVGVNDRWTF